MYDYVIVGAGSAGCVLANRLSSDPAVRVLLLEAGGSDAHPYIRVPIGLGIIAKNKLFDWRFEPEREAELANRSLYQARGKVLGGSSSINYMAFTRGHPHDYDRWAENGATGWSYDEVLPYFKRLETWQGGESAWRGGSGPIGVEYGKSADPLFGALLDAGRALGYPKTDDYNSPVAEGFGHIQFSIRSGRRSSSSQAYLRPVRHRKNLTVATGAHVHRVLLKGDRAYGVSFSQRGALMEARASREVLLCGGTFNSPQLLMLSGIGPSEHLRSLGIAPVVDLPVGDNLQDHLAVSLYWQRTTPSPFHASLRADRAAFNMARAYLLGTGPATVIPAGLHAFIKTRPELDVPDIEFMVRGAPPTADMWIPKLRPAYQDGFLLGAAILHPESRGTIRLRSADPFAPVRISNNFLSSKADLSKLHEAFVRARELGEHSALGSIRGRELAPGANVKSNSDIDEWIRANAQTVAHPVGTCRMGNDSAAVLTPDLRVRGIDGLRVVDASAMPDLVSAHVNACVLMMAEKAADLLCA